MTVFNMRMMVEVVIGFLVPVVFFQLLIVCSAAQDVGNQKDFWNAKSISNVTLQFATDQWEKMQPGRDVDWDINEAFRKLGEDAKLGSRSFRNGPEMRPGLAGYFGIRHEYGKGAISIDGKTFLDVGVRYKGNGTFWAGHSRGKYSFKVDFSEFGSKERFHGLKKINFNNAITDPSMLIETLSYQIFREAGVPASRTGWASIDVVVGEKQTKEMGLYVAVEQVDKHFLRRHFGSSKGLLIKPSAFVAFPMLGDDWSDYELAYVPKTESTEAQQERMIEFAKLIHLANDVEFEKRIDSFLDMDSFFSFLGVNVLLSNLDSFLVGSQNYYVYLVPETNKIRFIPWDLDISFGAFSLVGTPQSRRELSIDQPQVGEGGNRLIERVLSIERFRDEYHERLRELVETVFKKQLLFDQIDQNASVIRPWIERNEPHTTEVFEEAIGGNPSAKNLHPLKYFVEERRKSLLDQLDNQAPGEHLQFNRLDFNWATPEFIFGLVCFLALGATALMLNLVSWVWCIVAGNRRNTCWCLLNLFLYPFAGLIFGFFVDRKAGLWSACMSLVSLLFLLMVFASISYWFAE